MFLKGLRTDGGSMFIKTLYVHLKAVESATALAINN